MHKINPNAPINNNINWINRSFRCTVTCRIGSDVKNCLFSLPTKVGRVSSVGIASSWNVRGFESQWRRDFSHPSIPTLRPAEPRVRSVPSIFPGVIAAGAWR